MYLYNVRKLRKYGKIWNGKKRHTRNYAKKNVAVAGLHLRILVIPLQKNCVILLRKIAAVAGLGFFPAMPLRIPVECCITFQVYRS